MWKTNNRSCIHNLCTGDNPNFPISADNPVREVHGLIADYDAKPDNDDWMKIIDINCGDGLRPTYISKSSQVTLG